MAEHWKRVFSPSWIKVSTFIEGWEFFFLQEVYNLTVLFAAIIMWHNFVVGWDIVPLAKHLLLAVAFRRILAGGICTSKKSLRGQTAIITGANVGIGFETARDMLRRDGHVIMACRDLQKAEQARRRLLGVGGRLEVRQLDLSSLASVRSFAKGIADDNIKVHILINNAGVMWCPYAESADGYEMQMATNHLGPFLLTNLLLPQLVHAEPARIVNVSSLGHVDGRIDFDNFMPRRDNYDKHQAYLNTKLATVLFSRHLAKRLQGTSTSVYAAHPGATHTQLGRHVFRSQMLELLAGPLLLKTPAEGAQTLLYCAAAALPHPLTYFSDCSVGWPSEASQDDVAALRLWDLSAALVQLAPEGKIYPHRNSP